MDGAFENARRIMHVCIDMQAMFVEESAWQAPWAERILPAVEVLVAHRPDQTVFTRFMPPRTAEDASGAWQGCFARWRRFTRAEIEPGLLEIVPRLRRYCPPARILDKPGYSAFHRSDLLALLLERDISTMIVTGAETDVCVLASVLDAVDFGFHVVVVQDALCSSTDDTHDALLKLYGRRFNQQVRLMQSQDVLDEWS